MEALILVDLQNDFLPGGALAVPEGNEVIPVANHLLPKFKLVVATQDCHPANHVSFASNHPGKEVGETVRLSGDEQLLWPDHCVSGTTGAKFPDQLNQNEIDHLIYKGTDPSIDSYSGFYDNGHRKSTGLHEFLQQQQISRLAIMGLATDYCVKYTVLDALQAGYDVELLLEGCRGVNLNSGDVEQAIQVMQQAGAKVIPATMRK